MNEKFLITQSERLNEVIQQAIQKFAEFSPEKWNEKPSSEKWSKKEVLGHLTDSAANNHLRFVRAQLSEGDFVTHGYEQNFFVAGQHYQDRKAEDVIALWKAYNLHLAHMMKFIDPDKLNMICRIGNYEPQTLAFVIEDYVDHIEHHLKQILCE